MSAEVIETYQKLLTSFEGHMISKEEVIDFLLGYEAWLTEVDSKLLH